MRARDRLRKHPSYRIGIGGDYGNAPRHHRLVPQTRQEMGRSFLLLLVTVALGITLGVLHNQSRAQDRPDIVLAGGRVLTYPFQLGLMRLQGGASTLWEWLFHGKRLSEENRKLREEVATLKQDNERLRGAEAEAARLRAALKFVQKGNNAPLPAEVIGWLPSPHFETITVARGSRDGVREAMAVRTPDGLVGQVTAVSALSSQVMLLSDENSGVSALVRRGGKTQGVGIVQGAGRDNRLELVNVQPQTDIKAGDKVYSSGFGGVIPPEVPIGFIVSVTEDKGGLLKSAKVKPYAPMPGEMREVYLIR